MNNFAIETHNETRAPSKDRGSVWRWIIAPAIIALISGAFLFGGFGLMFVADKDVEFVFGTMLAGAGLCGLLTVVFKSFSFDTTGNTHIKRQTPVLIPDGQKPKPVNGNKPIFVASQQRVKVDFYNNVYHWTPKQLNRAITRFEEENYMVSRDHLEISTKEFQMVVKIMTGLGFWQPYDKDTRYNEWTEKGEDWVYKQMRPIESTSPTA